MDFRVYNLDGVYIREVLPITNKFFLYSFYCEEGTCLYVGKTKRLASRMYSHLSKSDFAPQIQSVELAEMPDDVTCSICEIQEINKKAPFYNKYTYTGNCPTDIQVEWYTPSHLNAMIPTLEYKIVQQVYKRPVFKPINRDEL